MMRKSSPRFLIILCLLTAITGSLPLLAQSSSGSISGMVTDDTGAGIPGVTVTVLNRATGATRTTVSEGEGGFTIPLVPPGMYDVSGELFGLSPGSRLQRDREHRLFRDGQARYASRNRGERHGHG